MKITNVRALLFLGTFVGSAAASTLGQCRAFCKSLRPGVLDDVSACLAAVNLAPVPKLYHACVDGRKKAFDRACVPLCARAALTVTSFEGCQAVKKGGRKNVDWCRKGYDSILQNPEAFLVEHSEKEGEQPQLVQKHDAQLKTESAENDVAENDLAANELVSEPVNIESGESNGDAAENDLANEPVNAESAQNESDVEANGDAEAEEIEPDVAANDAEVEEIDTVQPVNAASTHGDPVHGGPEGAAHDPHGTASVAVVGDRSVWAEGDRGELRGAKAREL